MHNFTQMEVKATHLAANQAIGLITGDHHCSDSGVVITHNLAGSIDRDTVASNHLVVIGGIGFMFVIVAGVKYLDLCVQINTQT